MEQELGVQGEQQVVLEEQLGRGEVVGERGRSCSLSVSVSVLAVAAGDGDKLRYIVRLVVSEVLRYRYTDLRQQPVTRTDQRNWFCGDQAADLQLVIAVMEAAGWRSCWVRSGAAGGRRVDLQRTSRRTFCHRDVSYRTGRSPSSGDTDRTNCNCIVLQFKTIKPKHNHPHYLLHSLSDTITMKN